MQGKEAKDWLHCQSTETLPVSFSSASFSCCFSELIWQLNCKARHPLTQGTAVEFVCIELSPWVIQMAQLKEVVALQEPSLPWVQDKDAWWLISQL